MQQEMTQLVHGSADPSLGVTKRREQAYEASHEVPYTTCLAGASAAQDTIILTAGMCKTYLLDYYPGKLF